MNKEKTFQIHTNTKNYRLITDEYIGVSAFKYMIRAELHGDKQVTLFLMGIPDPVTIYAGLASGPEDVGDKLYKSIIDSITKYISGDEFAEGEIYYGQHLANDFFDISPEKPSWEDGNWGQKL